MKFTAAGDALIQRRIHDTFEGLDELAPFIEKGDARFFNLETTLNYEGDAPGGQFSGGTYVRCNPECLDDMMMFGFNMTSFNNNHAFDFGHDGFIQTLDYVNESGIVHSGTGMNLDEAAAPRYLETKNGRVALIAVNTSFNPAMMAGIQGRRTPGRPGINGIRLDEHFTVTPEELEFIKSFATKTGINVSKEITRKEGYYPELADGEAEFGIYRFKAGEKTKRHLTPNKADMARLEKAIYEASMQADYIMVSIHSHQITGELKEQVPDFLEEICHAAIDMGANAVIGHGPHLLRPVEVYKDSPIFYCLGDFVLELYSIEFAPEDFYEKQGLTSSDTVHDLLKKRSANFTRGLMEEARMMQTVIPYWETEGGKLTKLEFLPVELVKDGNKSEEGLPRIAKDRAFMDYFAKISAPYGVEMEYDEKSGVYTCKW